MSWDGQLKESGFLCSIGDGEIRILYIVFFEIIFKIIQFFHYRVGEEEYYTIHTKALDYKTQYVYTTQMLQLNRSMPYPRTRCVPVL